MAGSVVSGQSDTANNLSGGRGDDTLIAGHGADTLTGGDGADLFQYPYLPWNAGQVTDFTVGTDHVDLTPLLQQYHGADPIADGWVWLQADGQGGAKVYMDRDGPAGSDTTPYLLTTLDHTSANLTWAQLGLPLQTTVSFTGGFSQMAEGNSGLTAFPFTITRSGPATGTTTVDWTVMEGSGQAPASDYQNGQLPHGTVTFAPGETAKEVMINVVGDTTPEPDEPFTLRLLNPTGATIGYPMNASGEILNDDGPGGASPPTTAIGVTYNSGQTLLEGNSGSTVEHVEVFRYGPINDTSSVSWAVTGSGAHPADGADFVGGVLPSGAVNFAPGENLKIVDVAIAGDTTAEPDEGFTFTLSNPSGASLANNSITSVIKNDDGGSTGGGTTGGGGDTTGGSTGGGSGGSGQAIGETSGGQQLTGGAGDDTLTVLHGGDTVTGGGGADHFAFSSTLPWSSSEFTDFTHGTDKIDVSALLQASGYNGADPVADGYVKFIDNGSGGTWVYYDTDGHGSGDPWGTFIATLDHVSPASLGAADLTTGASSGGGSTGGGGSSGGGSTSSGQAIGETGGGEHLTGGAGDDTLTVIYGNDTLTGAGGADHFAFSRMPWNPSEITDFTPGADRIDVSALDRASGYTGSNALADGYVKLIDNGSGGTWVYYDTDGHGSADQWGTFIATVDHTSPSGLSASDFIV